jgi:hypothetical protein
MTNSSGKSLIPLLALTGLIVVVGFVLYRAGFRITTTPATPPEMAQPDVQRGERQPGQHQRRKALAEDETGTQQGGGGRRKGGIGSSKGGLGGRSQHGRPVEVRTGSLGTKKIPVIVKGGEQSFTGADLEKLPQTIIAANRGARAGWRLADVLNHLTITQGTEIVLTAQDGKTLTVPWEQVASREPTLLLTYNSLGGLMLVSGKEVTQEEVQAMNNQAVKMAAKEERGKRTFLANINKIEVKS